MTDRLEKVVLNADLVCLSADFLSPKCGDHGDFGDMLQATAELDYAACLQAIHAGHVPVHQYESIGILRVRCDQFPNCIFARRHRLHSESKCPKGLGENLSRLRVVIDDQRAEACKIGDKALALLLPRPYSEPRSEMEGASRSIYALNPDRALHHFHETLGDREPEAGSTIFACRGCIG